MPQVGSAYIEIHARGDALEAEIRKIGEDAGEQSGAAASRRFNSSFDKGLQPFGKKLAKKMRENGNLAGETFADTLNRKLRGEFSKLQEQLADIFAISGEAERFAGSFDTAGDSVSQLRANLNRLRGEVIKFTDEEGELHEQLVVSDEQYDELSKAIKEYAKALEDSNFQTDKQVENLKNARTLQADLNKTMTSISDTEQERLLNARLSNAELEKASELTKRFNADMTALTKTEQEQLIFARIEKNVAAERMRVQQEEAEALGRLTKVQEKHTEALKKSTREHNLHWKSLSHNVRQVIVITAAIAAGAEQIATLGSALGPGLLTMGAALNSAAIGGVVMFAAFKNLGKALEEQPEGVRDAAKAFQDLGKVFDELQDQIAVEALGDTTEAWETLQQVVEGLTPALLKVAGAVGKIVKMFARGIAPGTKAFDNLNTIIENSADDFEDLMVILGTFGEALLNVFASPAMERSVDNLLGWIQDLADGFKKFTEGPGLDEWFGNADRIFGALGGVLEGVGELLSNLVDQGSVDRTVAFLDNIADFMGPLEGLLSALGELDVFGLLAELLADFGEALEPLAGPLEDLMGALNDIIQIAIDQWAERLGGAAEFAAPLVQALADALDDMDPRVIEAIADALLLLAGAGVVLKTGKGLAGVGALIAGLPAAFAGLLKGKGAAGLIAAALSGILIGGVTQAGEEVKGPLEYFGAKFGEVLIGAITGFLLAGPWGALAGALGTGLVSVFSDTEALIDNWTGPVFGEKVAEKVRESFEKFSQGDFGGGLAAFFEADLIALEQLLGGIGETIMTALGDAFAPVAEFFSNIWTGIMESVGGFFTWWIEFWVNLFAPVWAVLAPVGEAFFAFFQGMFDFFGTIWNGIAAILTGVWTIISGIISLGLQTIAFVWTTVWQGISDFFTTIWNAIVAFAAPIVAQVVAIIQPPIDALFGWWNGVWQGISDFFTDIWNGMVSFIGPIVDGISGAIHGVFDGFLGWWQGVWQGVEDFFGDVWDGLAGTAEDAINGILDVINGMIEGINGLADGLSALSGGAISLDLPTIPKLATGALVLSPSLYQVGEAGPEAVVPLNRPLSQVDPAVRGLSAYAQGLGNPTQEIQQGPQKIVNVMPGAIVVQGVSQPYNAANATLDRIVQRL